MYKFKLEEDFVIHVNVLDAEHPYVSIKDDVMTISAGYAWDGCTPKQSILGLWLVGTPDGHVDYRTNKQKCYYASLVHDALYQYELGTRKHADRLFRQMLKDVGFQLASVYYYAVRWFATRW